MLGMPQEFLSVTATGIPSSAATFSMPANCCVMLLNRELTIAEAGFVDLGRRDGAHVRYHPLAGPGVEGLPVVRSDAGRDGRFVGPTIAAEPLRIRALVEIDALGHLVLVHRGFGV